MKKVNAKDRFLRIKDFITANEIVSVIDSFLCDDDLHELCDYLIDEYDIDIEEDTDDFYDEDVME